MPPVPERGYPLSALFLLITTCAIALSMSAAAGQARVDGSAGSQILTRAALVGCGSVMGLGALIGLYHYRPGLGLIVGGAAGAVVGSMVGPLVLAPKENLVTLFALGVGGSIAIVILASWIHANIKRQRGPAPPAWFHEDTPQA